MSPGGSHGLAFIIFGLLGAGIVFGAAWLVTGILPFVDTVSFRQHDRLGIVRGRRRCRLFAMRGRARRMARYVAVMDRVGHDCGPLIWTFCHRRVVHSIPSGLCPRGGHCRTGSKGT